jgi:hypothetical protein
MSCSLGVRSVDPLSERLALTIRAEFRFLKRFK